MASSVTIRRYLLVIAILCTVIFACTLAKDDDYEPEIGPLGKHPDKGDSGKPPDQGPDDKGDGGPGPDKGDGGPGPDKGDGGPGPDKGDGGPGPDKGDGPGPDKGDGGPGPDKGDGGPGPDKGDGGPGPDKGDGGPGPDKGDDGPGPDDGDGGSGPDKGDGGPGDDDDDKDPTHIVAEALLCFSEKHIYCSCEESYRLAVSGELHIPPEHVDEFCNGPCLEETKLVLHCIDGIMDHFEFYNRATTRDVRDTILAGCGHGHQRGDFNVAEHIKADEGSASIGFGRKDPIPVLFGIVITIMGQIIL